MERVEIVSAASQVTQNVGHGVLDRLNEARPDDPGHIIPYAILALVLYQGAKIWASWSIERGNENNSQNIEPKSTIGREGDPPGN